MSDYVLTPLHLTMAQAKKLLQGKGVRLSNAALTGATETVPLTQAQAKKLAKSIREQKGMLLKLTAGQLEMLSTTGAGLFSDALAAARGPAAGLASSLLQKYGDQGIDAAAGAASAALGRVLPLGIVRDVGQSLAEAGLQLGSKYGAAQLQRLLDGMAAPKNGSGLYLPGKR